MAEQEKILRDGIKKAINSGFSISPAVVEFLGTVIEDADKIKDGPSEDDKRILEAILDEESIAGPGRMMKLYIGTELVTVRRWLEVKLKQYMEME